jgi:ribose transport system substrate-binding protein
MRGSVLFCSASRMRPPARLLCTLLVGCATALATQGCGDDMSDRAAGDMRAADVAGARAQLEKFRDVPDFTPPGAEFHTGSLRGKKIVEIPITSEVPFVTEVERGMKEAAATVGAEVVVYKNQGMPTQWAQGIRTAIAQEADAITLLAQDPSSIGPQIRQAEEAGIPVIVLRTTGEGERCPADRRGRPYGTTCVPGPFEQAGRLEADWTIAETDGKGDVLVISSNDARSTDPLLRGLRGEFGRRCPACDVRFVDVPIPQWARQIRGEVQSALVRDPEIDYVIPIYDSMSQYVVPAIRAGAGRDRVKIAAFNGTPFVLKMLQDEDVVAMDAGENLSWIGWASMDQSFRVIAGERPVRTEHTPLRVFDNGNVDETGRPPAFDRGYGARYKTAYRQLWGVEE